MTSNYLLQDLHANELINEFHRRLVKAGLKRDAYGDFVLEDDSQLTLYDEIWEELSSSFEPLEDVK